MRSYRHTQVGWVIVGVTLALAAIFGLTNRALLEAGPGLYVVALFPVLLLLVGTLTVIVEEGELRARFGIGLIGKTIRLSEVEFRFFPGGTLYNVSGLQAVELRMDDGRSYRIGSDQPHALECAIRALVRESRPLVNAGAAPGGTATMLGRLAGGALVVGLLGLLAFAMCLTILEPRPPKTVVTADTLTVQSFAYKAEVPLRDVAAVSLEPCLPRVLRRTNAFVIVGYDDPQRTRALEGELRAAWAQVR